MKLSHLIWIVGGALCLSMAVSAAKLGPDESEALFVDGSVVRLEVDLDQEALAGLKLHPREYVKGTVREKGEPPKGGTPNKGLPGGTTADMTLGVYTNVGVHLKGNY